jgi:hypothetical protein
MSAVCPAIGQVALAPYPFEERDIAVAVVIRPEVSDELHSSTRDRPEFEPR